MLNFLLTHTPLLYLVQSVWRDEAFSILAAQQSLSFIITKLGFEPPVYYTLLHFWIKLFGSSEIATRSLSMVGFLLATVIVIEWADTLYKKHWLAWYLPVIFFLNPMLLYYAFEVRTYAWYTFFATATLYTYSTHKWRWFIAASVLGFYTHVYMLPFIGVLGLHWIWTKNISLRSFFSFIKKDAGIRSFLTIGVLMIPWLVKIGIEATKMKTSWYYPVDSQLIKSVLGNIFIGYEGTPWYGWKYTRYLSLGLIATGLLALRLPKQRDIVRLFILFGALPLTIAIAISFIKPLFVNRYFIPATIAEVFIVSAAIAAIRHRFVQKLAAVGVLSFLVWFNWWYPPLHAKPDIRSSFEQINIMLKAEDVLFAADPLIYLETLYYAKEKNRVYLFNPNSTPFPWYIGDALFSPSREVVAYPTYPMRAIVIYPDTSFEIAYRLPL